MIIEKQKDQYTEAVGKSPERKEDSAGAVGKSPERKENSAVAGTAELIICCAVLNSFEHRYNQLSKLYRRKSYGTNDIFFRHLGESRGRDGCLAIGSSSS